MPCGSKMDQRMINVPALYQLTAAVDGAAPDRQEGRIWPFLWGPDIEKRSLQNN